MSEAKHRLPEQWRGNGTHLRYTDDTSNKYWGGVPDGNEIVCVWGRIGHPPQGSKRMSRYDFDKKWDEKYREGYELAFWDLEHKALNEPQWFKKVKLSEEYRAMVEGVLLEREFGGSEQKKARKRI